MKAVVRAFVFTLISFKLAEAIFPAIDYAGGDQKIAVLLIVTFSLLNLFLRPLLDVLSLPSGGFLYILVHLLVVFLTLNILSVFIPSLSILAVITPDLKILGFVLPSKNLTGFWAAVSFSALFGALYIFFIWLCSRK